MFLLFQNVLHSFISKMIILIIEV